MKSSTFLSCVGRLHPRQAIYLTFMNGTVGILGVKELLRLTSSSSVTLTDPRVEAGLLVVKQGNRWEGVSRTVAVSSLYEAPSGSLDTIAASLECVAAGDHFAKALFTGSKAKLSGEVEAIVREVLDGALVYDVEEWGFTVKGELIDIEGLPAIKFTITKDSLPVVRVSLDGWSGRAQVNKSPWSDTRCSSADQVRQFIRTAFEKYLELATAAA